MPSDPWGVRQIEAQAPDGKSLTAARELLSGDAFPQIDPTADGRGWSAVCRGSTDLYRVTVRTGEHGFECDCTCPSRKYPCKHALALLFHLAAHPELREAPELEERGTQDFEGLLHAIFADPDDDTPRLIFADYLDENDSNPGRTGQTGTRLGSWSDRAALIRVQCALARQSDTDERAALADQEAALLGRIRAELGTLPEEFDVVFERGFVRLRAGPEAFQNVDALPARVVNLFLAGWVARVQPRDRFSTIPTDALSLFLQAGELDFSAADQDDVDLVQLALDVPVGAAGHRLARVRVHPADEGLFRSYADGTVAPGDGSRRPNWDRRYWGHRNITPDHLERLLRSGRVDGITELTFNDSDFGDRGAAVLANGDLSLVGLELNRAGVGPTGAAALARAGWFPRLHQLTVSDCAFANAGVAALGDAPGTCAMERLRLRNVDLGDAGAGALAASVRFPSLELLELKENEITEIGAAALIDSEHFPRLRRVVLDRNPVPTEHGVRLALEARERPDQPAFELVFDALEVLRTSDTDTNGITHRVTIRHGNPVALAGLAGGTALRRVTALTLVESALSLEAATGIASALSPAVWRTVDLTGCLLSEKPGAVVERLLTGHTLTTLGLMRTGMKYADVYKLSLCPALASVKVLDLSANPMGTGGLEALLASPHLSGIERLVLKELNLTQRDRARFQKQFGKRAEF